MQSRVVAQVRDLLAGLPRAAANYFNSNSWLSSADVSPHFTPRKVVALARDLLAGLPRVAADSFTVIFGDAAAAEAAGSSGRLSNPVAAVDPSAGKQLLGPLLIVGATQQQVRSTHRACFEIESR